MSFLNFLPPAARDLVSLGIGLAPAVRRIRKRITRAVADGDLTSDEAAKIGGSVSREIGDLRIEIWGADIVDSDAQREILRGLARIVLASVLAGVDHAADPE